MAIQIAGMQRIGGVDRVDLRDEYSCKHACEVDPTCMGADFNKQTWICYTHGADTICAANNFLANVDVWHYSKIPCKVVICLFICRIRN